MSLSGGGVDLVVRGGRIVDEREGSLQRAEVLILGGRVQQVGRRVHAPAECPELDARGKLVLPGMIDTQVHFREPGLEHKEDLASGSRAAVAGGITAFCEMPNTRPPTSDPAALSDKLRRASGRCRSDHAFFLGATADNADQLGEWERLPGCAGIKVFMGSSTGSLLIEDDASLERVLRSGTRRVAVHSEDELRLRERYAAIESGATVEQHPHVRDVETALRSTTRLLDLVEKTRRKVHVLHLTTAEEVALIKERDLGELVTCEVTPNHLFLAAPDCYRQHGTRAQMNPPIRDARHQRALRAALADGTITCVGSDHAPHSTKEKARPYPDSPSGIPGVQTTLTLLLTAVADGWLTLPDVLRVLCVAPTRIYGIEGKGALRPGDDGDVVVVDPGVTDPIRLDELQSNAGWSPFVGLARRGAPVVTVLRGHVVWRDGVPVGPPRGAALLFSGT